MAGTIIKGSNFFHTTLYEGNGIGQRVGRFVPFTDSVTIGKSCIFNRENTGAADTGSSDNPSIYRSVSSAGSTRKITLSFWFKHGVISTATTASGGSDYKVGNNIFAWNGPSASLCRLSVFADYGIGFQSNNTSGSHVITKYMGNFKMGDTTKWYHVVMTVDTTQSNNADKIKYYVDGQDLDDISTPTYTNYNGGTNADLIFNDSSTSFYVGDGMNAGYSFDGYLAEVNYIDGTIYGPSKFGQTDTSTGRWIPKAISSVTYGTNGCRLEFANTANLGQDTSGNGLTLTVSAGITANSDSSIDTPSTNYATFLDTHEGTKKTEGNLEIEIGNSNFGHNCSSLRPESGKWYAEFRCITKGRSEVGIQHTEFMPENSATARLTAPTDGSLAGLMWYANDGKLLKDSSNNNDLTLNTYDANDIIGIALDLDTAEGNQPKVSFYKNGTIETNGQNIPLPHGKYCMVAGDGATGYGGKWVANFGQNPSFSGGITAAANTDGSGSLFKYTPPTNYKGLKQDNMPDGKDKSDFVWIKNRDASDSHQLYDSNRGPFKDLQADSTNTESDTDDGLSKFLKGGFEVSLDDAINTEGESIVGWNWVCNGGTTSANTDGSGAGTCTFQVNDTAGFAITQYTGTGSDLVLQHGLTKKPEWTLIKSLDYSSQSWTGTHVGLTDPDNYNFYLDLSSGEGDAGEEYVVQGATTTVLHGSGNQHNRSGTKYIMYSWTGIPGYSKFGKYTGSGNADGPFVFTGFKPSWLMIKMISENGYHWCILDDKRNPFNPSDNVLKPNLSDAEDDDANMAIDLLSNGFKIRGAGSDGDNINKSNATYVYMAFAEHPFNGDGSTAFATAS